MPGDNRPWWERIGIQPNAFPEVTNARRTRQAQANERERQEGRYKNTNDNPFYASSRFGADPEISSLMDALAYVRGNPEPLPPQSQQALQPLARARDLAHTQAQQAQAHTQALEQAIAQRQLAQAQTSPPPQVIALPQAQAQAPQLPAFGTAATAVPHGPPARPMNPNLIMAPQPANGGPNPTPAPDPFYIPSSQANFGGQLPAAPIQLPAGPAPTFPIPAVSPQSTPIPQPAPDIRALEAIRSGVRPNIIAPPPGFTVPGGGSPPLSGQPAPGSTIINPDQFRTFGYRTPVNPAADIPPVDQSLDGAIANEQFLAAWPAPVPAPVQNSRPVSNSAPPPLRAAPPAPETPPVPAAVQPKPDPATAPRLGEAMPEALKEQLLAEAMRIVRERPKPPASSPPRQQIGLGAR